MAWELRQNENGSWYWEVFLSANGVSGTEDGLAMAAAKLAVAEVDMLDEPMSDEMRNWFLAHAREHLEAVRYGLIEEIGRNVFPLHPAAFKRLLRSL